MRDPAVKVKDLLVAAGVGTLAATSGWAIHVGGMPDKNGVPHTAISVQETGGEAANPRFLFEFPHVQVMVRGAEGDYTAASDKCRDVMDALLGYPGDTDTDGDRWTSITAIGGKNYLGRDQSNRPLFSLNFRIILEPDSGTYRT